MSVIDVRNEDHDPVQEIRFADPFAEDSSLQAYKLEKYHGCAVKLYDGNDDYVYVNSEDHARNLVKALEKAIDLGWFK